MSLRDDRPSGDRSASSNTIPAFSGERRRDEEHGAGSSVHQVYHGPPPQYGGPPVDPWDSGPMLPSLNFREVLTILRRNAWLMVLTTAIGTGIALYVASQEVPEYRGRATLRMEDARRALAGQFDGGYVDWVMWRTNPLLTESVILKENREVGAAVVERLGLRVQIRSEGFTWNSLTDVSVALDAEADSLTLHFLKDGFAAVGSTDRVESAYGVPIELEGVRFTVPAQPAVRQASLRVVSTNAAIASVLDPLKASARENTNLMDLDYRTTDARLAQLVVNAVAEEFQAYNFNRHRQISVQRRAFIEEQIRQMGSLLGDAYRAVSDFRRDRQMYGQLTDPSERQSSLHALSARRDELISQRETTQALIEAARFKADDSEDWLWSVMTAPGVNSNPIVAGLFSEIEGYRGEREQAVAGEWGTWSEHPDVQRLDGLIATAEARLLEALNHHVGGLDAQISALDGIHARNLENIQEVADAEMEETWLQHEISTIRNIVDQLRAEYQRARISEAVEMPQFVIMNLQAGQGSPLGTQERQTVMLGILLGFLLGGGGALARETLNTSIRRRDEIEAIFGVPGLGVIPRLDKVTAGSDRGFLGISGRKSGSGHSRSLDLVTTGDLLSSGSEAYRVLRTNLIFSHAVRRLKTLLVTSPSPAEGKSTTAANLAVAIAQQGMRVALIDCDLRRARLHTLFGMTKHPGLTEFLIRSHSLNEVMQETSVPGLYLIPSGAMPPNPSDLLGIDLMRELLEKLPQKFDFVILDSPPLLTASDATILGLQVDGTLLVVRAGKTERGTAQHAMHQLTTVGGRVVGVVLNDPDQKVAESYYYYNSYYYSSPASRGRPFVESDIV